jgi:hypothetical protein
MGNPLYLKLEFCLLCPIIKNCKNKLCLSVDTRLKISLATIDVLV